MKCKYCVILSMIIAVIITVFVLNNASSDSLNMDCVDTVSTSDTLTNISEDPDLSPTFSLPSTESIGDIIPLSEIEDAKTYRVSSAQSIDEALITDLVHTLQIRAGQYSEKSKILAENDCGTWYIRISIPDAKDLVEIK